MPSVFMIPGKPTAWQRARKVGNRHFTLPAMVAAQHAIAAASVGNLEAPLGPHHDGPVMLDVVAYFEIPKSWSKKKRAALLGAPHAQKPDASNIAKQVEDALNGIAYHDDAQVVDTRCRKFWGEYAQTVVSIEPATGG
ncbi:RusA family crossover junction endodeoxyribonuclease [Amaricoccus solimangrovi]|uniref:RusA family crossover junction endodeoxyribonuclease n=1 Tax=Amaricoccus solimangrovi TaxID=2589815 RepID=A0A501WX82_9RHOB|nr:RusA family crossover junction endodeoxyribonuclease [Amaricoccus solimangrovi]TPE53060.1 RusA family crossover junction endodeoxyribonuclease [Amaricoccus solimangrovi]